MEKVLAGIIISSKKVLIISQYFWPEDFRSNELASNLKNLGYIVEVLTSTPQYPNKELFLDFYTNSNSFNDFDGLKVYRCFQFSRGKSKFSLVLNYLSFVFFCTFYILRNLKNKEYDFILSVQLSPISSSIPSIVASKIFRAPLYLWILDLWPDSLNFAGIETKGMVYRFIDLLSKKIYKSADLLLIGSKGFKKRLLEMEMDEKKIFYFPQWVEDTYLESKETDLDIKNAITKIMSQFKGKTVFLFAGNIGEAQDFPSVLKSFKLASSKEDMRFIILGDGRYKVKLDNLIKDYELCNVVHTLGRFDKDYMPSFYNSADYLLLSLSDSPGGRITLPGKMQTYMNAGKPILAMINGEAAELIAEANCGFAVNSGNTQGFALLLQKCNSLSQESRKELGKNGKRFAKYNFSVE